MLATWSPETMNSLSKVQASGLFSLHSAPIHLANGGAGWHSSAQMTQSEGSLTQLPLGVGYSACCIVLGDVDHLSCAEPVVQPRDVDQSSGTAGICSPTCTQQSLFSATHSHISQTFLLDGFPGWVAHLREKGRLKKKEKKGCQR